MFYRINARVWLSGHLACIIKQWLKIVQRHLTFLEKLDIYTYKDGGYTNTSLTLIHTIERFTRP